ncbi:L-type lectin-domain containing receptor kinase IX.1 [Acorus calamus]|uniref:non-specific serine/threonine protein kinase n=1 Tax=Acorus calamus TaxID=4465 RepID=A0AAV9FAY0_ACOCL|nr:L-type lectin-domain containing receptor kinase IX.1 [Acorus calamus]
MAVSTTTTTTIFIIFIALLLPFVNSIFFNFSSFDQTIQTIKYQGDAFSSNRVIQVTKNQADGTLNNSVGWATYADPVPLYDRSTGKLTDFSTRFSFIIKALDPNNYGDGLAFFLAPFDSVIPNNSDCGQLGLYSDGINITSGYRTVAVEFDSYMDPWDPSSDHVGIDVGSIVSNTTVMWKSSIKNGSVANAWVSYNASTKNLSVFLTYANNPVFSGNSSLSTIIDLRDYLPESVVIGFSASTGSKIEIHNILNWEFQSTLVFKKKSRIGVIIIGSTVGVGVAIGVLGLLWFFIWKKRFQRRGRGDDIIGVDEMSMDDEFAEGTGPKRFPYIELSNATNGFDEAGKLGEGGFGAVYKGVLGESKAEVAIKRVSRGSKQGRKEYASEVRIISRLRHRNLVQLLGWCHERGDFLLVYELMPNGSLDTHLFGAKDRLLNWSNRHKVALGLASSLLYLHEEWEQCVVHRDVKSSNVMLDSGFNARLGDFGLARLVDHERGSQTTVLAGTMGYLAPECVTTGKASKESDVYSFGVVALEIACGRRPVEPKADEERKVRLVEWVWGLYGQRELFEAVDERLGDDFDRAQMERLMVVGLWCAHPDFNLRPSIRQAISVLNFEAPLPELPSKMPVPTYYAPPMDFNMFSYTTSGISASDEFRNAGPLKQDLTSHVGPTTLAIYQ